MWQNSRLHLQSHLQSDAFSCIQLFTSPPSVCSDCLPAAVIELYIYLFCQVTCQFPVLYLSMSQSCEEATYFSQHANRQLPRADLTRAEEQQSQALHRMQHWAMGASFWQSGAWLTETEETLTKINRDFCDVGLISEQITRCVCKWVKLSAACTNLDSASRLPLELQS